MPPAGQCRTFTDVWRRLVRLWRLSRGWTYLPPPPPACTPLYTMGTQARIDGLRGLYTAPAGLLREADIAITTTVH